MAVQGNPGTGKTTLFEAALPAAKAAGFKVIGIAPTAAAVAELESTGVFDKVMTVQRYVLTPEGNNRTLLIMDEASLVGTDNMRQVLKFANDKNIPRVALVGDTEQLPAIERGRPFADLQAAGMRTAKLDEIVRQADPRHRNAITDLTQHNLQSAFDHFKPDIHETPKSQLNAKAAKMWAATQNPLAAIVVQTNAQKAAINSLIKTSLSMQKPAQTDRALLKIWKPVHVTQRQKALTKTYHDVSHIRFNRDVKKLKIKRGEVFKVESINDNKCTVALTRKGRSKNFKPAKHGGSKSLTELYKQEHITLDQGDRIRFTRGGRNKIVSNNDMGVIHAVGPEAVTIKLDKGKTITLNKRASELRHIDHAWANTAHAFQGKTVKDAIVVMPSQTGPLTRLESLTVGMSRHRTSVALVTDNAEMLKNNLKDTLKINTQASNVFREKFGVQQNKSHKQSRSEKISAQKEEVPVLERAVPERASQDYGR